MRSREVAEPFRSDHRFWRSVAASVFALVTLLAAGVVSRLVGAWGAAAFALPLLLLAAAARNARASTAATRPTFATRDEWRDAERQAVAAALMRGGRRYRGGRDDDSNPRAV
jgi:hypothetical protein